MQSFIAGRPRGRRNGGRILLFTILLLTSAKLRAQTATALDEPGEVRLNGPLTLDEALRLFRLRGFDLVIADAAVAGAEADITTAGAIANPALSLTRGSSSTYNPAQCAGCSSTSIGAGVTDQGALSDLVTGKRRLRMAVASAALEATRRSRADAERTLEVTVKQEVLQAELAKRSLAYSRDAQQLAANTLALVETRYHAGAVSEADVARAEVQKLEADQSADSAAQALASAKSGLAYLLGFHFTPADLDVDDDLLRTQSLPRLTDLGGEEMFRAATANRPDLAQARSQVERAQSSLALARRLRIPDLQPSLSYSAEGRGQNAIQPPTVTFGVAATIPVFYRYRGEIAHAEADLRTQQATRRKVEAQIGADVGAAVAAFKGARARSERMDTRLLARAARARDLVRLQYEKGAVSLFEFLDAQRTWLATQSESLQTLNDYWTAVFQLEQSTAMELR